MRRVCYAKRRGRAKQPTLGRLPCESFTGGGKRVCVWYGQEKDEGRELKHRQPPPFAQSAGKRPLVIPREAGNVGVEELESEEEQG